jgi:hypothetical protein
MCFKIFILQTLFQTAQHLYERREGSVSGSVPLTNGCGSGRPKNVLVNQLSVLQVGCWTPSQRTLSAFEIEWIPDILPQMRIGELRIKFEYGHQRNGQIERRRF